MKPLTSADAWELQPGTQLLCLDDKRCFFQVKEGMIYTLVKVIPFNGNHSNPRVVLKEIPSCEAGLQAKRFAVLTIFTAAESAYEQAKQQLPSSDS